VSSTDFRKHAGLFWVLRHEKVLQMPDDRLMDPAIDYAGFHPDGTGTGTVRPVPDRASDLTYLSDAYGVYRREQLPTGGHRAHLIDGGLTAAETQQVLKTLRPGGTLVGEFNILSSPTPAPVAAELAAVFGVAPTGWVGRHFNYLDLTPDLPAWMAVTWLRQTGTRWAFRGPGYVFVHADGRMVVLVEGVDTPVGGLRLRVDDQHAERTGMAREMVYDGWVEILKPMAKADVLATYDLTLTPSGARKMRAIPVSTRFPAIVRTRSTQRTTWYFAGDWSDRPGSPGRFRYQGIARMKRWAANKDRDSVEEFYWGAYVPLMRTIIRQTAEHRRQGS
jgi:hypothetical protein